MSFKSKYKGLFKPQNPQKYLGDPTRIIFRSMYELKYMKFLDAHPDVLKWGSEEVIINYLAPDGRIRRYFPDFVVQLRNRKGEIEKLMVEIKPYVQTQPPKRPKKLTRKFLQEAETYAINKAKWAAATQFCEQKGLQFKVYTEHELGIKNGKVSN